MINNYSKEILQKVFDGEMIKNINSFAKEVSDSNADIFIVMARKAACFVRFLQRCGAIDIAGLIVTDRVLDIDVSWIKGKKIAIVDDVIVSGTTIYKAIQKVASADAASIEVYVLGVTETCNTSLFDYYDSSGIKKNYLHAPYVSMTEAGCIRTCSDIVTTFSLDISPYDVDFPRHKNVYLSESVFERILNHYNWDSYDVASSSQSREHIYNITLVPNQVVQKQFDEAAGLPVSKMGFYKIRVFAKNRGIKNKPIMVNVVPYFLFNAISEDDANRIFEMYFEDGLHMELQTVTKIRLLQYVLAEKLFNIWIDNITKSIGKIINTSIDKEAFEWIFPRSFYYSVEKAIKKTICYGNYEIKTYDLFIKDFDSVIKVTDNNKDNKAILQSKLIEPFTRLYHEEEKRARLIVQTKGIDAFEQEQYETPLDRLNHGYSYQELIYLLQDFPDYYDKNTMVSLFLDEGIDAGIVVPIISREKIINGTNIQFVYYRAYRHGEDVPFGEEQEKKCAILLKTLYEHGGSQILSNLRVEKMLVLFLNIGISQNLFTFNSGEEILYNVNAVSYLHGKVTVADDPTTKRSVRYLKHRTDAVWLTDKLETSGILIKDKDSKKYIRVEDPIDLPIDGNTEGKIGAIGDIFGVLYNNKKENKEPNISDKDLVVLSTCLYPKDIINAMAAELAICFDRWIKLKRLSIPLDKIPDIYKKDNLYVSVNSGKDKYFSFINKIAIKRIYEIEEQFKSDRNTRIYANNWKQFWPENIEWDNQSIGDSIRLMINREGQCLIWYNILLRLLFATCVDSKDLCREWLSQAADYCNESLLFFKEFNNDKVSQNISDQVRKMQQEIEVRDNLRDYYKVVLNAIDWLTYKRVKPLLQEIDIYIDKHGKPIEVEHFGHIVFCQVKNRAIDDCCNRLSRFTSEKNIGCRVLTTPFNDKAYEGIWIYLRVNEKKSIKKLIRFIDENRLPVVRLYIFRGLSDSLKIRSSKDINSNYRYGSFLEYFGEIRAYVDNNYDSKYKLVIANEVNNGERHDSWIKNIPDYKLASRKKIQSKVLFYDQIAIRVYCKNGNGEDRMLYEWYETQKTMKVFISYTESEETTVGMIESIVNHLKRAKIDVLFYEDMPIGTDLIEFMRRISGCDYVLIIGSKLYKEKAQTVDYNDSGVSFEDRIIAGIFQSVDRSKIIPVTFSNMKDTIPVPFDTIKGIVLKDTSPQSLDSIVKALLNAYKSRLSMS